MKERKVDLVASGQIARLPDGQRAKFFPNIASKMVECAAKCQRREQISSHSVADLLNENGEFDINHVREQGLEYLVAGIKVTRRQYRDVTIETTEYKVEPRTPALEMLGRHFGLWDHEIPDPLQVLADMLAVKKHQIPTNLGDEPLILPSQLIDNDGGS